MDTGCALLGLGVAEHSAVGRLSGDVGDAPAHHQPVNLHGVFLPDRGCPVAGSSPVITGGTAGYPADMELSANVRRAPLRLTTGAFVVNSGVSTFTATDEQTKKLQSTAAKLIPQVER